MPDGRVRFYPAKTVINLTDLLDVLNMNAPDLFEAQKMTIEELRDFLNLTISNLYNQDGLLGGNRTVFMNSNELVFDNGNVIVKTDTNDGGLLVKTALNAIRASLAYDISEDSGALALLNAGGLWLEAIDGVFKVNTNVLTVNTNGVGMGIVTPNSKSILDIASTTKGMLTPRMTTVQRDAIVAPPKGLIVFDITANQPSYFDGSDWLYYGGGIKNVTVSLSAAQILNGDSVPIEAISAQGAGTAIEVISSVLNYTHVGVSYDIATQFEITSGSVSQFVDSNTPVLLQGTSDAIVICEHELSGGSSQLYENQPIMIHIDNDSTVGDGTAIFYITYRIITL